MEAKKDKAWAKKQSAEKTDRSRKRDVDRERERERESCVRGVDT